MLRSRLHAFLRRDVGIDLGLFSRLALAAQHMDRRAFHLLTRDLDRLDPASACRPDGKHGQRAAGWLMAGSILAGMPSSAEENHFHSPATGSGLDNESYLLGELLGLMATLEGADTARQFLTRTGFDLQGTSALAWAQAEDNPFSATRFYDHLAAAMAARTPRERDHRLAIALVSMGGLLHVLQDMASPTHVRNDYAVGHLERLGGSPFDRGSAYERLVAAAYGQQGLPTFRGQPVVRARVADYFSNGRWTGLADRTATEHFSPGTLPPPLKLVPGADPRALRARLESKLLFSRPALGPIDLACARRRTCHLRGKHGPLLAYRIDAQDTLRFFLDQDCYAASARVLLPQAVSFSAGIVDFLLRGRVRLERTDSGEVMLKNEGVPLVSGKARLFSDDESGVRTLVAEPVLRLPAPTGAVVATLGPEVSQGRRVVVVLEARDDHGEPLVATAQLARPASPAGAPGSKPGRVGFKIPARGVMRDVLGNETGRSHWLTTTMR
jgi:hypothetical protein